MAYHDTRAVTRRGYLGSVALGVVAVSSSARVAARTEVPGARQVSPAGPTTAPTVGDLDGDRRFATATHLDGDPAGRSCGDDDRDNVVHVTSGGEPTTDYAASLVDVADRGVTLGDVTGPDGRLAYDYLEGPESTNAAPDEAFVVVDWRPGDDGSDLVTIAYLTSDDGVDPAPADVSCEEWRPRDVAAELREPGWRDATAPVSRIESGEMLLPLGVALRGGEPSEQSPLERFGEDTRLLAVGFGQGFTTQEVVVDVYYDGLVVGPVDDDDDGVNDDTALDFPVALPIDVAVDQRGDGAVLAMFALEQEEAGVELADLAAETVGLWPFEAVTSVPPSGAGAIARAVRVRDGRGELVVPASEVDAVFEPGEQAVLVSGSFDDGPAAVVGVAEFALER